MPLIIAPLNVVLKIIKIVADENTKTHLDSLGLTIDSEITLLSNCDGNTVCIVKGERLALDKNLATKIFVSQGGK